MNPDYAKALVKRGEINQELGDYDEAVRDFSRAAQIDPSKYLFYLSFVIGGYGAQQKLKYA
jgi:tetratricopeptide (TPR) repeat protein